MTKPKTKPKPPPLPNDAPPAPSSPKPPAIAKTAWTAADVTIVERVGLSRASAMMLLGYLSARKDPTGAAIGIPVKIEEFTANMRKQCPWVWSALGACDYVRMSRALEMCGLPGLTVSELQAAAGRTTALFAADASATA